MLSQIYPNYGLPFDNIATGFSVVVATAEIFGILDGLITPDYLSNKLNISTTLQNKTYTLEGFGKVATGIAKLLENNCHLLAISTKLGMINYDPENEVCSEFGFIPSKIIHLQSLYGDEFIFNTGQIAKPEELFSIPCDFLIPGARTEVITEIVARKISGAKIKAIVPASNFPYTSEGLAHLESKGVVCAPDFISNAGAVIYSILESSKEVFNDDMDFSLRFIQKAISLEMRKTINEAISNQCKFGLKYNPKSELSMYQFAIKFALEKKENLQHKKENLFKAFLNRYMPMS